MIYYLLFNENRLECLTFYIYFTVILRKSVDYWCAEFHVPYTITLNRLN